MALPSLVTRRLLRTDFVEVDIDYARRVVVLRRSAAAFRHSADVDQTISDLARTVPDHSRAGASILLDMRDAPVRANPELDVAFQRYRAETERGFECVAVVVQSTLGKIRSDRLKETSKADVGIFLSLDEALAWLSLVVSLCNDRRERDFSRELTAHLARSSSRSRRYVRAQLDARELTLVSSCSSS